MKKGKVLIKPSVVFVVGPTASGKTDLALEIAQILNAPVINADSIQLYQGLQIGSSAPSLEQKELVPHELFQVIPKGKTWTIAQYEEAAWSAVERHLKRGVSVVIVGGSGFYIQALEKGLSAAPPESPEIRLELMERIKVEGEDKIFEELRASDPETAKIIHPRDHYRLVRALAYFLTYGRPFSLDKQNLQKRQWDFPLIKLGLTSTQERLKSRIRARTQDMIKKGFVSEVSALRDEGLEDWWPMKSVGYFEVVRHLRGECGMGELEDTIVAKTLLLAKKQKTWFQRDKDIQWFDVTQKEDALNWFKDQIQVLKT